jgi:hypothetical protein
MQRIFINKCFLFTVGRVCSVKRFSLGGKRFADDEEVETEVRKWLRQQWKCLYAAGFDAPVKRWDKCISVGGGYVEKRMFSFPASNFTCFTFYINFWPIYWLSLVCTQLRKPFSFFDPDYPTSGLTVTGFEWVYCVRISHIDWYRDVSTKYQVKVIKPTFLMYRFFV